MYSQFSFRSSLARRRRCWRTRWRRRWRRGTPPWRRPSRSNPSWSSEEWAENVQEITLLGWKDLKKPWISARWLKKKQSRKSYPVCSSWNYCVLYLLIFMWNKKTHDSTGQNRKLTKKQKPWERNSIKQLTQWKGSRTIRRKKMECPTNQHRGMRKHKQQEKCASR